MATELTSENFHQVVLDAAVPVLVDFWAPTCAPCRRLAPIIEEIASETDGRFQVGKINAWEQPELTAQYQISALPTLLIFDRGKVVNRFVGYHEKALLLKALRQAAGTVCRK
jgi:thioredoxin 1